MRDGDSGWSETPPAEFDKQKIALNRYQIPREDEREYDLDAWDTHHQYQCRAYGREGKKELELEYGIAVWRAVTT